MYGVSDADNCVTREIHACRSAEILREVNNLNLPVEFGRQRSIGQQGRYRSPRRSVERTKLGRISVRVAADQPRAIPT
jgi:hypothetical protein